MFVVVGLPGLSGAVAAEDLEAGMLAQAGVVAGCSLAIKVSVGGLKVGVAIATLDREGIARRGDGPVVVGAVGDLGAIAIGAHV